jgi:hypothetical protein
LRCRIRLADGRTFSGELPPERHRALQLGLLHAHSDGLIELAAGTRRDGTRQIHTRAHGDHFLPGGGTGHGRWLDDLLELAATHADRGEELFIAPAVRSQPRGDKHAVAHTRALWVDIDRPGQLHHLWAFLADRPSHLLIESGGGGAHAYWLLDRPLRATQDDDPPSGRQAEPIERAHARIIHRLGVDQHGRPYVADPACRDRSRLMRLGGSVNGKTGRPARILEADFKLEPYPIGALVGDLPDPPSAHVAARRRVVDHPDPYKRISPPEYFERLAGIEVPRGGLVRCPAPGHQDQHPSCSVGTDSTRGWKCHSGSCGAGGAIYETRLRRREITLREILENPPAELERQMTWEVLLWTPGIGRTRLRALNVHAIRDGHVNLAAPLGALTVRQRNWLASRLCP